MPKKNEQLEMAPKQSLSEVICKIKADPGVVNEKAILKILDQINKYGENEKTTAYLLGILFNYIADAEVLSSDKKLLLISTIKEKNLTMFYYHKSQPNFEIYVSISWVFVIVGIIILTFGILKFIAGYFSVGILRNYLLPTFDNGFYGIILGSIMFFAGIIRLNYETKKTRFIKSLTTLLMKDI